jgi:hypothetical protein
VKKEPAKQGAKEPEKKTEDTSFADSPVLRFFLPLLGIGFSCHLPRMIAIVFEK